VNLPSYEFLSAPLWLITLLHVVTLTLHFVAMGMLFGGTAAIVLTRRARKLEHPGVVRYVRLLPTLMALTVTLGVAPLLFLQLVYHRQVYAAAVYSAWPWLGVVGAAIVAYYLLYSIVLSHREPAKIAPARLRWALLFLLFVSLVLSSVFTLAERPATIATAWAADASGLVLNPELGRWLPRWLHLVAGALALGSFALAVFVRDDEELFATTRTSYLWSQVAAMVLGVGALVSLGDALVPYMRSPAVWWMLGSLLLALGSIHFLFRKRLVAAGALLFVSLVGMVVNRHIARLVVLGDALDPSTMAIRPQWSVFVLFLVCFVAMLGVVAWMLKLYFGGKDQPA
jgi:hypothetical protein